MTAMTDLDRLVASWLETDGPADIRVEVVAEAFATARQTTQRRGVRALLFGPARWPASGRRLAMAALPLAVRVAIVVALGLAALVGTAYVGSRLIQSTKPLPAPFDAISTYKGVFVSVGAIPESVPIDTLSPLSDGRVLIVSGSQEGRPASIWDPATQQFTDTGRLQAKRSQPLAFPLGDGRVLIIGGDLTDPNPANSTSGVGPSTAELYNQATGTFALTGPMQASRWIFGAAQLADGRVLVTGGVTPGADTPPIASAEVFDLTTATFSTTGSMTVPRMGHSTVALRDGRALVVGGISTSDATTDITVAELYDPLTGTFSPTGSMAEIRRLPNDSQYPLTVRSPAVALPDGRVLVAGLSCQEVHALRSDGHSDGFSQTQTELYDPSTGTFSMAAPMPHCVETATTLPNGQVFVTGWWYDAGTADTDVEKRWSGLYDPTTGYTRETAAPPGGRYLHLVRLADGHVVVIGDVPDHVEVFQ